MSANRFQVGLVQMAMSTDPAREHGDGRGQGRRGGRPRRAGRLPARAVPHALLLPDARTHALFDLAEPIPGPTAQALAPGGRGSTAWRSSSPSSSGARRASTTTPPSSSTPTARWPGSTARCTSPTTRSTTRSSTSRPGDLGFQAFDTPLGRIGTLVCWDQWYPGGGAAHRAGGRRASSSTRRPSAGTRPRRPSSARPSATPGRPCSAATPSPTACYVAAVNRVGHEGEPAGRRRARVLGRARSSAIRSAWCSPRPRTDREEILVVDRATSASIEETRRHWPFLRDRRIDAYGGLTRRFRD